MEKLVGKTGDIILVTIATFLIIFIIWANLASLEKVIRGEGKVVVSAKTQVIQNLEGCIIKEIYVKAVDIVKEGQALLKLDDTVYGSELDASRKQLNNLNDEISSLRISLDLIKEELDILKPLVEQGAESRM